MLDRHQQRAVEFRARADQARESSRASGLPSVRERQDHAADRWDALAEMEDAFIKGAMEREAARETSADQGLEESDAAPA